MIIIITNNNYLCPCSPFCLFIPLLFLYFPLILKTTCEESRAEVLTLFYLQRNCDFEKDIIVMSAQVEIQNHPFFESLSWTDLVQKKIPPPFNPNVAGPDDIRNFDAAFTEESVPYSVCVSSDYSIVNASVLEADDAFVGFSYAPPSEDLFL
uniref:Serum/glucocorticoid regulated kinase family member 3 n=1 Tax=Rousettus aegyptiacus TaxID=9407 RepID=A0A7J8C496_ROUAE|nr:serum/glucocorticoid regulated kinase family member 3 [Rousettus aegyptiacus]